MSLTFSFFDSSEELENCSYWAILNETKELIEFLVHNN